MTDPTILATGIGLGESPRWHEGRLWFADWLAGEIIALDPAGGREVVLRVPSFPISLDWLPDGTPLVVSGREGRLLRGASLAPHADLAARSAHPWNELVADGRGNAYVNNTGFDFPGGEFAPGLVALAGPDGSLRDVADDLAFPNGMAITPDGATLLVAESYAHRLTAFDIGPGGELANRRAWAELGDGVPDGICLDADGAAWYADVPNKRCVRVREGGEVLDTVTVDRGCFACMLGGEDGRTLFVAAADWRGPASMGEGVPTGQILAVAAPAPRAGRP